jgi:hypothetical protein
VSGVKGDVGFAVKPVVGAGVAEGVFFGGDHNVEDCMAGFIEAES